MTLFCMIILIAQGLQSNSPKLLIYLTIWSYLLLTVNFISLSVVTIISCVRQWTRLDSRVEANDTNSNGRLSSNEEANDNFLQRDNERTEQQEYQNGTGEERTIYGKLVWLLWIVSSGIGLIVTLLYWTIVARSSRSSFLDVSFHALNSVFILIELFTNSIPVNLLHGLYVMIFGSVYVLFTVIYWAAGGLSSRGKSYIYNVTDYENGKPAFIAGTMIISAFVIIPLVQLFLFGLYQLRCHFRRKLFYPRSDGRSN